MTAAKQKPLKSYFKSKLSAFTCEILFQL